MAPVYADPDVREKLSPLDLDNAGAGAAKLMSSLPELWDRQREEHIGQRTMRSRPATRARSATPRR